MGDTCGALTGAIIAVGLVVGRQRLEDKEQYRKSVIPAQEVYRRFCEVEGATLCSGIHKIRYGQSFLLSDPKEREGFLAAGGHEPTGCPDVCCNAAKIAADVILDLFEEKEKA